MSTERRSHEPGPPFGDDESHERRCGCGKLAARVTAEGVEIKCARCKRVMIVSWSEVPNTGASFSVTED